MVSKHYYLLCAFLLTGFVTGCKTYSLSVNNNLVYTPASLFKDFIISDPQLRACLEQTIQDNHITKVEDLKQLNCARAGITSLSGLEKFYHLEQVNLAENSLQSIAPIATFSKLKVVILSKNNLTNAEPLLHLMALREVDVSGNSKLGCNDLKQLSANFHQGELKLVLPEQCR